MIKPSATQLSRYLILMMLLLLQAKQVSAQPLYQAHAHNDYAHQRPLLDALDHGFNSVEADIFLQDDQLLVGHEAAELTAQRTLQVLYLEPLWARFKAFKHKIYSGSAQPLILLIDFKTAGSELYPVLHKVLQAYQPMLSAVNNGEFKPGAVTIIISGDVPRKLITANPKRQVFIDGRIPDLDGHYSQFEMPLISARWSDYFEWDGKGQMPSVELAKLNTLTKKAHQNNQLIRFWGTPDTLQSWQLMQQSGVDLINTDDLQGLSRFLTSLTATKNEPAK